MRCRCGVRTGCEISGRVDDQIASYLLRGGVRGEPCQDSELRTQDSGLRGYPVSTVHCIRKGVTLSHSHVHKSYIGIWVPMNHETDGAS